MTGKNIDCLNVWRVVNSCLQSNTYVLYSDKENIAWIIDPGDADPLISFLQQKNVLLKGILLTHSHFDHIYGINKLLEKFVGISIYASDKIEKGLKSPKLNGSYYAEMPFVVDCGHLFFLKQGDTLHLYEDVYMIAYETPGHSDDSLSFEIKGNLFTGDALIPGVKTYTRSKNADKKQAEESIKWMMSNFSYETIVYPGHKNSCKLKDWD